VKLSIEEFEKQLVCGLRKYVPGGDLEIAEMSIVRLKARYHIGVSLFIDIFYAIRTEKVSFAVVQKGERVFGIDNLGCWHCHPFGKPENHEPIDEPSLEEIVSQCTIAIKDLKEED
jgi:hypothetical protein